MTRGLRVVIAEDDVLLRDGLLMILGRFGHEVVAALPDTSRLAAEVEAQRPDVVVTDVRMPPTFSDEGLRAALALRSGPDPVPVLVLSQYVEQTYATELLESGAGAVGYLLKDRVGQVTDFVEAVEQVANGGTVVDPAVVRQLIKRRPDPLALLTPRELEVLSLMAEGRSNAAICKALVVTEASVAKHIGNILTKLDLLPGEDDHRRVLAVLTFLAGARRPRAAGA